MSLIANSVNPDEMPHFVAFHQFSLFVKEHISKSLGYNWFRLH